MKIIWKILRWGIALFFCSSILAVIVLRFVPVYVTPLMVIRSVGSSNGEYGNHPGLFRWHHTWVPLVNISRHLPVAVMASEDQRFLLHRGFDYSAIEKAALHNMRQGEGGKKIGASTISQQTAKNVFLWPGRSWLRKGLEAYFTVLIEMLWSKQRIMEVYLNSIEMGNGVYGAEAVAMYSFGKKASELSRSECALIAATLPNPRKYSSKQPSAYMRLRQRVIERQMRFIPSFPKEGARVDPQTVSGGVYKK